jgi:hypothetical protein
MPFRRHRSAAGSDLSATLIGWVPATADITLTFRSPWQGDLSMSIASGEDDLTLPGQLGPHPPRRSAPVSGTVRATMLL